jgi:molecular chaperone GrpE
MSSSEPVRIEIVDKRQRDEAPAAAAPAAGPEVQAAEESPTVHPYGAESDFGSFCEVSPEADSEARLRARDDAERWYAGSLHHSSAIGSERESSPDAVAKAAEYLELAQRKEAELRNYRSRVKQDMEDARRYAIESLLHDLFPVHDALAQALSSFDNVTRGADPLLDGVRNTAKALEKALLKHGVEKIDEAGVPFDSELHQPVQVEASDQVKEDTVIEVFVAGYKLHGKVLKPAMVKVLQPA